MLGRLARWLRVSGLDVEYQNPITHHDFIIKAKEEGRRILTRSSHILKEHKDAPVDILITANYLKDQLRQFYTYYNDIDPWCKVFSRCLECNVLLKRCDKSECSGGVPDRILKNFDEFYVCPKCNKIYWPGSHVERMKSFLKDVLQGIR